jgi:prolyl-tRNA synthetase
MLETIHTEMYNKALNERLSHVKNVDNWKDFMDALSGRNLCLAPWCNVKQCEKDAKERSKEESIKAMEDKNEDEALLTGAAKTLCIPHQQDPLNGDEKCFACGAKATVRALWGRSY